MHSFIDRRQNPKGKSHANRQRFVRRARALLKEEVDRAIRARRLAEIDKGGAVSIPGRGVDEPRFRPASAGGRRIHVLAGNDRFLAGDRIPRSTASQGRKGPSGEASPDGGGEDAFIFALDREEFLDLLFDGLELPNLVRTELKRTDAVRARRAGYTTTGNAANLHVLQTLRQSHGRRLALKRPSREAIHAVEEEIRALESIAPAAIPTPEDAERLAALRARLAALERRRKWVPYIDPLDLRYRELQHRPDLGTNAVMFCLMDVSGSMGEREKDLAKRFFLLLHLFLRRRYERVDVVFIRHTHKADEVDEETFFFSRETGGTIVSTALVKMLEVIEARYPLNEWNIYAAQASDGDNYQNDSENCHRLLQQEIMPKSRYYAYVEILDEREFEVFRNPENGASLWRAYRAVNETWPQFAMKRVAKPADIYPVFRELFSAANAPPASVS